MRHGLRFLGHPVHPALTDFPIALWSVSLLWNALGFTLGDPFWGQFGFWTNVAGLLFAIPTVASGLMDYIAIPEDRSAAERTATRHMIAMLSATGLFTGSLIIRIGPGPLSPTQEIAGLIVEGIGVAVMLIGGWLGGELVFRHGIGRNEDVNSPKP